MNQVLRTKYHFFEISKSYRELFEFLMCADRSDKCTLNECDKCPGAYGINGIQQRLLVPLEDESIENVSCKQWMNSGAGLRLETVTRPANEFVDNFCEQLVKLNSKGFEK